MPQHELAKASDAALVARFAAGRDQGAFAEIVRRHGPMVKATAARILRNHHDAEDAFQATFLALAKAARRVKRHDAIAGWLHRTAVRAALAVQRGNDDWRERLGRKAEQMELATSSARHDLLKEIIDEELERLPPKCRTAVVLCDLEGLTRKAAASRLGIPIRTISSQVAKGRQLLRLRLVKRGIGMSAGGLAAHLAKLAEAAVPLSTQEISKATATAALFAAGKGAAEIGVSQLVVKTATSTASGVGTMTMAKMAVVGVLAATLSLAVVPVGDILVSVAKGGTIVSPNIYADAPAPSASSPNWPQAARAMGIFNSSEFADLPDGGADLLGFSLRPDESAQLEQTLNFARVQIRLSVTSVNPAAMSNTFANNITGSPVVVFEGPWSNAVENTVPSGAATRPFDFRLNFDEPFFLDPAAGNLVIDWTLEGPGASQAVTDHGSSSNSNTYMWSGNLGANSLVGDGSRFSIVTEFTFVPEPSTSTTTIVSLVALGGIFIFQRRWRTA